MDYTRYFDYLKHEQPRKQVNVMSSWQKIVKIATIIVITDVVYKIVGS